MALTKHTAHAYNYIQTKRVSCQISCQFGNFEIDTLLEEFIIMYNMATPAQTRKE